MNLIKRNTFLEGFLFWEIAPAFFFGTLLTLSFLVGMGIWAASLPLLVLLLTGPKKILSFSIVVIVLFYTVLHISFPEKSEKGSFVVQIESVRKGLKKGFLYSGTTSTSLPCLLYSPTWIDPSFLYRIDGTIKPAKSFSTFIQSKGKWQPIKPVLPIVEWRYLAKQKVKSYLASVIAHKDAYFLLVAFATGNLDDSCLAKSFERAGLSHLLVISGFHFALVALFIYFFLHLFLPPKASSLFTLLLLSFYFFFLGNSPSVLRSWIASMVFFLGKMTERQSRGLNSLGAGLILAFILDPISSTHLSFQLSFLATGAIFLVYPPLDNFFKELFPEKKKRGEMLIKFIRQAVALDLAVHLTLFPFLLFTFHKLPLHSIFYNLFFPSLFTPTLLLLLLSSLFHFLIPPLGLALHSLNSYYSHCLLFLLDFRPFPHFTLYSSSLNSFSIAVYLTLLFVFVLRTFEKQRENESYFSIKKI